MCECACAHANAHAHAHTCNPAYIPLTSCVCTEDTQTRRQHTPSLLPPPHETTNQGRQCRHRHTSAPRSRSPPPPPPPLPPPPQTPFAPQTSQPPGQGTAQGNRWTSPPLPHTCNPGNTRGPTRRALPRWLRSLGGRKAFVEEVVEEEEEAEAISTSAPTYGDGRIDDLD